MQTKTQYTLSVEGNDIDAKTAQNLKVGDSLSLKRVDDSADTFEIVVCTDEGKELDMLSYEESVGIAPFLDDGSVKALSAKVLGTKVIPGATRAKDITKINFEVNFEYDGEALELFCGGADSVFAFMPKTNPLYSLCLYRLLDYGEDIITQTHLNRYVFEVDIDGDTMQYVDFDFGEDKDYFFVSEILFNGQFNRCRVKCRIECDGESFEYPCDGTVAEVMLTFVNHLRIFNDEEPLGDVVIDK